MRTTNWVLVSLLLGSAASCGSETPLGGEEAAIGGTGELALNLTSVPTDVACVKVSITGARPVTQMIDVTPGTNSTYTLSRLPLGIVSISAEAYSQLCNAVPAGSVPAYVTDAPVSVRVDAVDVNSVSLSLLRNGRIGVGVDFESGPQPYLVPVAAGVTTKPLFTVGDTVNNKPNGTPYRMVGIPDGLGAMDNGDGTFTLLMNHEISSGGTTRAHGNNGAFVSKWRIRKSDMTVLNGSDLIQNVSKFDVPTLSYLAPATGTYSFSRFCSADLPAFSAFYDAASGTGYNGRIFTNGEESGNEGKAWGHVLNGTSYELPRLGKASWENIVANPATGIKTVVAGLDDTTPGQVYIYVGTKGTSGNPVQQAGLTNGTLFGVSVSGVATEDAANGIPSGTAFSLASLGNVEALTGAVLDSNSTTAGVTRFNRPEDGAWDPSNPSDFYFVTTASFTTGSRLWRLHFADINNPAAGGTLDMLLSGNEGQKMLDNLTLDTKGHVYLQEDVGNQAHIGKVWRYTIATDDLTLVAQHNPLLFTSGATQFLTQDEEASGIIDASSILGAGWFLMSIQAHYSTDSELVEGGQLIAFYDAAAL